MCYAEFFYKEIAVKNLFNDFFINKIIIQRIIFLIEEILTFFCPGIIWFYYGFKEEECRAPTDESLAILVNCYFTISIFLLLPTMNMCAKKCCFDFCCIPFLYSIYILGKFVLMIIMLTNVQNDYKRSWDDNLCSELKGLTLFWLIFNYIMLGVTFIYYLFFMGIAYCECDYGFDEYDIEY